MEPVRVAIICFSRSWGGLELKLVEVARALQARGNTVVLVVPPKTPMERAAATSRLITISLQPRLRYLDFLSAWRIARKLRPMGIQSLVAGQSRDVSTALLAKRFLGNARLVFFQQMQFELKKRDLFHRWAYGGIDRWVTLTARMRETVLANTTVPSERMAVLPVGSDLSRFDPSQYDQAKARTSFGLPPEPMIIAVVGRIDPQKGQETFLRAIPGLLAKRPDLLFLVVGEETKGESGYRRMLGELVRQLGVSEFVRFLSFTDEMPRLLAAIDVLVLPSLHETFGYIVVEAMAMGKPVVGTNAGGVPEIIEDGRTGYLVPPGDASALEQKVFDTIEQPDRYSTMSARAREVALSRFNLVQQLPQIEALLAGS
jgi:D-inositol-3-phosphate glycosyltransferase